MPAGGFIAVLVIHLHFPDSGSLKSKRQQLSSIKAALHGRLGATVAEIDHQDLWQRSTLAAAVAGRSPAAVSGASERIAAWLASRCPDGVRVDRVVVSIDELCDLLPVSAAEG